MITKKKVTKQPSPTINRGIDTAMLCTATQLTFTIIGAIKFLSFSYNSTLFESYHADYHR